MRNVLFISVVYVESFVLTKKKSLALDRGIHNNKHIIASKTSLNFTYSQGLRFTHYFLQLHS